MFLFIYILRESLLQLNEKIEETNNMKYKFESSQIYDIEKKLQRLQTILDRKNDFFR